MTNLYLVKIPTSSEEELEIQRFFLEKVISAVYTCPEESAIGIAKELNCSDEIYCISSLSCFGLNDHSEVQECIIDGISSIVHEGKEGNVLLLIPGIFLGAAIQFFDDTYTMEEFQYGLSRKPWITQFTFEGEVCKDIQEIIVKM